MNRVVEHRNMFVQVLLMIVTFGLYSVYWFYVTSDELKSLAEDANAAPVMWTILLFIPFGALYSWYKHAELFQAASSEHLNRWILFILWLVFSPAVWFIVQLELNKRAAAPARA